MCHCKNLPSCKFKFLPTSCSDVEATRRCCSSHTENVKDISPNNINEPFQHICSNKTNERFNNNSPNNKTKEIRICWNETETRSFSFSRKINQLETVLSFVASSWTFYRQSLVKTILVISPLTPFHGKITSHFFLHPGWDQCKSSYINKTRFFPSGKFWKEPRTHAL